MWTTFAEGELRGQLRVPSAGKRIFRAWAHVQSAVPHVFEQAGRQQFEPSSTWAAFDLATSVGRHAEQQAAKTAGAGGRELNNAAACLLFSLVVKQVDCLLGERI
eukprot:354097-Chlamydomonas_euryale.AAC.1